uniref:NADH dehydrogenase subunit 3 n=1 Tax=Comanthus parvicirrus TaxID=1529418 RepID=UPI001EDFBD19|nr:NADH dehydrogenase subunit 3 [Comanthus parvicirrus]UFQ22712.1 NADH dehydrogenase subunit 3 [Comanthus parvicirrus]UHY39307.1 NADH dehydrogenase subunit 3 [Comanthus parvicirrus]
MNSFIFVLFIVIMVVGLLCFFIYFLPLHLPNDNKNLPYECGFDPLNSARVPFSFRFFLVAILFLLFDLEIALLFPLPYSLSILLSNFYVVFISSFFIILLTLGLVYEWLNGGLEWAD